MVRRLGTDGVVRDDEFEARRAVGENVDASVGEFPSSRGSFRSGSSESSSSCPSLLELNFSS